MPDLNSLKDRVLDSTRLADELDVPMGVFGPHYTFEDWLSTLGEYQPYLSEQQNLANAERFAWLRDAIADVLVDCEAEASASDLPRWLDSLIRLLHHREATVVTLNYDRLVEIALRRADLQDVREEPIRIVDDRSAVRDIPPTKLQHPTYNDLGGWAPARTLRLIKLHGSLDWWMSPRDATGSTLVRDQLRFDQHRKPVEPTREVRSRVLTGRERGLVPPVLSKGSYFNNFVTRQLWQDASEALSKAHHVAIVGYSLPTGDSMMAGLLVSTLRREGAAVTVVNRETEDLVERVGQLASGPVDQCSGTNCVANYVAAYLDRADAEFCADFVRPSPLNDDSLPIVVTTGSEVHSSLFHRVVKIEPVGDDTVLLHTIARGNAMINAASDAFAEAPARMPSARDLATSLEGVSRVVVDLDGTVDGWCRPVRAVRRPPEPGTRPIATLLLVVPDPSPSRLATSLGVDSAGGAASSPSAAEA